MTYVEQDLYTTIDGFITLRVFDVILPEDRMLDIAFSDSKIGFHHVIQGKIKSLHNPTCPESSLEIEIQGVIRNNNLIGWV
jgi:hypothetical protein